MSIDNGERNQVIFKKLLHLFLSRHRGLLENYFGHIKKEGINVSVITSERTVWSEPKADDFFKFPVVEQKCSLMIDDGCVFQWKRFFHAAPIDIERGTWRATMLENELEDAEKMIEILGIDFAEPSVPDPIPL